MDHIQQGLSFYGQLRSRVRHYLAGLFPGRIGNMAMVVRELVLPLHFTPIAPMLWDDDRRHIPAQADESALCDLLYHELLHPSLVDMGTAGYSYRERSSSAVTVHSAFSHYVARKDSRGTDNE
jgi:hypothetical protein